MATVAVVIVGIGMLFLLLELAVRVFASLYLWGEILTSCVKSKSEHCDNAADAADFRRAALASLWWLWWPIWVLSFLASLVYLAVR
jgi:hypothetical protein